MVVKSQKTVVLASIALDKMAGGLEKNLILLANALHDRGHDVHITTFDLRGATPFYPFKSEIPWHQTGVGKPHNPITLRQRIKTLSSLRKVLKNLGHGTIVICFHHGILARFLIAGFGLGLRMICSERHSLSIYKHIRARRTNFNFWLLGLTRKIIVQFPSYRASYPNFLRSRIIAIANPVAEAASSCDTAVADNAGRFSILCVARLGYQKNLGVLIEAFARIADQYPLWDLKFAGDGEDEEKLKKTARRLGIGKRVFFLGKRHDVPALLCQSHIFCLPSLWEGFPNALAEAMAHGLPCVGFESCDGVRDLIRDGETGFLAKGASDPQILADALALLMKDSALRVYMGNLAKISMKAYQPEFIFDQWDALIDSVSKN